MAARARARPCCTTDSKIPMEGGEFGTGTLQLADPFVVPGNPQAPRDAGCPHGAVRLIV